MDLITLAATCIFACTPVTPQTADGKQYQQWEDRLQGSIRSNVPSPAAPEPEGQEDSEGRALKPEAEGTALPSWLQGTWRTHASTLLYAYDYKSGKNLVKKPSTVKLERLYARDSTSADKTPADDLSNLDRLIVLKNRGGELKIESEALVTCSRKGDREMIDIFIEKSTIDYQEIDDGVVQVMVEITDYSIDNKPRRQSKSFFIEKRIPGETVANAGAVSRKDLNETSAHSVDSGLGAIVHRQFIEDVAHVGFGRSQ